ncbi:cysteine hydrolase family protein [soil metagenome]
MIDSFGPDAALLVIDAQCGVDDLTHWGGDTGRRNNPNAEDNLATLLRAWRDAGRRVMFTMHDSLEATSPLKLSLPTGQPKPGLQPRDDEEVIVKRVNGAFFGTDLDIRLRRTNTRRLIIGGFFTNMCVETTARTAGNLGYDTYLCADACATTNRVGPDNTDHDPAIVHQMSIASIHGEFATALATAHTVDLLDQPNLSMDRAQGNE